MEKEVLEYLVIILLTGIFIQLTYIGHYIHKMYNKQNGVGIKGKDLISNIAKSDFINSRDN
jgi:hypothetical protein